MLVFVTRALSIDAAQFAAPPGIRVEVSPHARPLSADEIATMAAQADGIVSMLYDPFDASLISRLPKCKVIANHAAGVNNIDLAAAHARGIRVCNTPDVLTGATAELAMTLMLVLARRVREGERILRSGAFEGWAPDFLLGSGLDGKTLGLFGFGRIGRAVAKRAVAFGMNVLYHTRARVAGSEGPNREGRAAVPGPGIEPASWARVLRDSDVLSLHAPLAPETRHIIDATALASMKRTAILINTARGPLVDEAALAAALEAGTIAGAGLDVFEHEPAVHPGLLARDDVVLLPHVGSATVDARRAMATLALEGCFAVLAGHVPPNRVG